MTRGGSGRIVSEGTGRNLVRACPFSWARAGRASGDGAAGLASPQPARAALSKEVRADGRNTRPAMGRVGAAGRLGKPGRQATPRAARSGELKDPTLSLGTLPTVRPGVLASTGGARRELASKRAAPPGLYSRGDSEGLAGSSYFAGPKSFTPYLTVRLYSSEPGDHGAPARLDALAPSTRGPSEFPEPDDVHDLDAELDDLPDDAPLEVDDADPFNPWKGIQPWQRR